jgi:hypothetical protein
MTYDMTTLPLAATQPMNLAATLNNVSASRKVHISFVGNDLFDVVHPMALHFKVIENGRLNCVHEDLQFPTQAISNGSYKVNDVSFT